MSPSPPRTWKDFNSPWILCCYLLLWLSVILNWNRPGRVTREWVGLCQWFCLGTRCTTTTSLGAKNLNNVDVATSIKDWLFWLTAISMKDECWKTSDPLNDKWVTNAEPSSASTNQVHIVQRFHHRRWCHSHLRHSGDSSWGPAIQFCKLILFRMNRSTSKID